jgi:hypothetical protein
MHVTTHTPPQRALCSLSLQNKTAASRFLYTHIIFSPAREHGPPLHSLSINAPLLFSKLPLLIFFLSRSLARSQKEREREGYIKKSLLAPAAFSNLLDAKVQPAAPFVLRAEPPAKLERKIKAPPSEGARPRSCEFLPQLAFL